MYNGIGLKTPRGSGTNGYVTRNLSFVKPKPKFKAYDYEKEAPPTPARKPNDDVLLHKSKREIEVECLQLREKLEVKEVPEEEIEKQVKQLRKELTAKLEDRIKEMKDEVLVERKEKEMKRIRRAFGITDDFVEGRAFNFETESKRQERLGRIEEEERVQKLLRKGQHHR